MKKAPFKMKGNPMKRNFGISPMKKDPKKNIITKIKDYFKSQSPAGRVAAHDKSVREGMDRDMKMRMTQSERDAYDRAVKEGTRPAVNWSDYPKKPGVK
jgi:hypothetical protein